MLLPRPRLTALLSGVALLLAAVQCHADWPQWRGPSRDGHADAKDPGPSRLPESPKVLWRLKIGDGLASPVMAGETVFHLDHQAGKEVLHAVDRRSGQERWSRPIDDTFKDSQSPPGPRCTPMVDGDRVYAQSCRGRLTCLAVADGATRWSVSYPENFGGLFIGEKGNTPGAARHGHNGMPIIDGDQLIALAGGTNGAGILVLDKRTGTKRWSSLNDPAAYAPPVLSPLAGRRQILAFMVDGLIGASYDGGQELWRVPIKTAFARHASTPVVVDDLVIVSSHQAGMIATRVTSDASGVHAQNAWTSKEAAMNVASPVVVGKHLYGLGPTRNLFCVDATKGSLAWSKEGYFTSTATKAYAGFLVLGGHVLCLTDGGLLVLFAADPAGFKELGQAQVCGANWCNPAYGGGLLVLRDARELIALDLLH